MRDAEEAARVVETAIAWSREVELAGARGTHEMKLSEKHVLRVQQDELLAMSLDQ